MEHCQAPLCGNLGVMLGAVRNMRNHETTVDLKVLADAEHQSLLLMIIQTCIWLCLALASPVVSAQASHDWF